MNTAIANTVAAANDKAQYDEYAKRLMKEQPQLKVQDISESSGFLSTSHFSRTFSSREGCSPAHWRQSITD